MKFEIGREVFRKRVEMVFPVIPTRTNFPVLQNILLEVDQKKISFLATDLDVSIQTTLAFPEEEKDITATKLIIRGREFLEILKELTEPTITLETEDNLLKMQAGKGEYSFSLLDPQEFPELPQLPKETDFYFPASLLSRLFSTTAFAISKETGRPAISGILWEIREKETRMVATDGHRLALIKKEGDFGKIKKIQIIIPPKVFNVLPFSAEEKIKVSLNSALVGFVGEDYWVISRVIEGPYPDYEKVLPTGYPFALVCPKEDLIQTLSRTLVFAPSTSKIVIFNLTTPDCSLEVSSELGVGKEVVKGHYKGEKMKIAFNGTSLQEILRHIESEEVELGFTSPSQACVIKPVAEEERKEKLFLIMPMRME